MQKLLRVARKDPVLFLSGFLAALTMLFVPPDRSYVSYIDLRTLALLFALMAAVGALSGQGLLDAAASFFIRLARTRRGLGTILVLLCYTSSMLITNDVALIAFVPLCLILMRDDPRAMLVTVVVQTVAANLGSMLTPFGNPQNLYLYSVYRMTGSEFFAAVLPAGALGLGAVLLLCLLLPAEPLRTSTGARRMPARHRSVWLPVALFLLCVAAVLRFVPYPAAVTITAVMLLITDREALRKVDYRLLITFCFFFVFVGNLARMEAVKSLLTRLLTGNEVLVSALASQFISNVPAALMLSSFTDHAQTLVTGTNIGGMGTLIASMASLISFKLYCQAEDAQPVRYLGVFTLINMGLLCIMLAIWGR